VRFHPSILCAILLLGGGGPAYAQPTSPADRAAADALFDEARKLMAEGRHARACPKLAAAQKLRPGVGTLLNLAACYEKLGRTASAWATFRDAATAAQHSGDERQAVAEENEKRLAPRLTRLTIVVASPVPGLVVARDGLPVDVELWGVPLPIDPGTYLVEAHAPGRAIWSKMVEVKDDGATVPVTVPALASEPVSARATPPALASAPPSASAPGTAVPSSSQRTLGIALVAGGAVGAVVGTVFGLMSMSAHDAAAQVCTLGPSHDQCDSGGYDTNQRAINFGNISTIAFVVGGAALATGGTLWLTAPSSGAPRVGVTAGPARLGLTTTF
jgi:hypothetical protein